MLIMSSMVQKNNRKERTYRMEEKIYKTMSGSGALSITLGVISIVVGIAGGVLLIVSGAKLLAGKSKIMF